MIKRQILILLTIIMALVLYAGCVSVVEKTGRVLDGSAFAEKAVASYTSAEKDAFTLTEVKNKAGEHSVLLALGGFPMMKIRGTVPNENGEFFLVSLEYLGGNIHGWNEYTLELAGAGSLVLGETAVLSINGEIEKVEISQGRIHRYDTRITGTDALTGLRNRRERIAAVAAWMNLQEGYEKGKSVRDFENYWKPVLLPEMVSKKQKPEAWQQEGDIFEKADDIRWNTGYTERVFSEELWPVRNSGTLLRDWEEAIFWLYLEYEWDSITEKLSREIILQQKKVR